MISTQFGHVPDVAFEEIKQMRSQQQPVSLPFFAPTFVSTSSNPSINSSSNNDTLFLTSNQTRPTVREVPVNNSTGTSRSRSLANNTTNRTSVAAASTNLNNPVYQAPLLVNKQTYLTPTRFGIGRINPPPSIPTNNSLPSGPSSSSTAYINNRNLPISTSPNIRYRSNPHQQQPSIATALSNPTSSITTNNSQQNSHYETTYRSSFIKPLVP